MIGSARYPVTAPTKQGDLSVWIGFAVLEICSKG